MEESYFIEGISDECLLQLIESSIKKVHSCHVDELCNTYMINNNHYVSAYGITHRYISIFIIPIIELFNLALNR